MTTPKLRHQLNPCDIDRYAVLAPVGDLIAKLATECPCCNGLRILTALAIGFLLGAIIA